MEHVLHFGTSECRWLSLASDVQFDPLKGLEIERLAVAQVVGTRVKPAVDDEPIAQYRSTVVSTTRFDPIQILGDHLLPPVRHQVVEEYFTVDWPVRSINKTARVTGPTIDAQVVLVGHHDMVRAIWVFIKPILCCVLVVILILFGVHRFAEVQADRANSPMCFVSVIYRLVQADLFEICLVISCVGVVLVQHLAPFFHFREFYRVFAKVLDVGNWLAANTSKHEHTAHHGVERGGQAFSGFEDVLL